MHYDILVLKGDYNMNNRQIGNNIRKMRKYRKLTQKQLGQLIGKTESSIQKYECGYTEVPRSVLESIAENLDIHLLDLLDDQGVTDLYDVYDTAAINYYKTIGYKIDYSDDGNHLIIKHNGYGYIMPIDLFFSLEDSLRLNAEHEIDLIISKYCNTKFKL